MTFAGPLSSTYGFSEVCQVLGCACWLLTADAVMLLATAHADAAAAQVVEAISNGMCAMLTAFLSMLALPVWSMRMLHSSTCFPLPLLLLAGLHRQN